MRINFYLLRTFFHLKKARGEIWPKRSERRNKKKKQKKNYQDEDKKSAINKKLILRLKSLISKRFQLKTNLFKCVYFSKKQEYLSYSLILYRASQFLKPNDGIMEITSIEK